VRRKNRDDHPDNIQAAHRRCNLEKGSKEYAAFHQIATARANENALIGEAAQDLVDYQRLTAEGKLAEAGQKLEQLKWTLGELENEPNVTRHSGSDGVAIFSTPASQTIIPNGEEIAIAATLKPK
jgi:hypothetical protein